MDEVRLSDDVLATVDKRGLGWGAGNFYVAFLGAPSERTPWILQIGGHHLAYNFTFNGERAGATPLFFGTEPTPCTTADGATHEPLKEQSAAMIALAQAIAARPAARLSGKFTDVVKGVVINYPPGQPPTGGLDTAFLLNYPTGTVDRGIRVDALAADEQALVRRAIESYASLPAQSIAGELLKAYREAPAAFGETYAMRVRVGAADLSKVGTYVRIDGLHAAGGGVRRARGHRVSRQAPLPCPLARQGVRLRRRGETVTRVGMAASPVAAGIVAAAVAAAVIASSPPAEAHPAASSSVAFDIRPAIGASRFSCRCPSWRAAMTGRVVPQDPGSARLDEQALRRYVVAHVSAESDDGAPWAVAVSTRKAETPGRPRPAGRVDMMPGPSLYGDVSDLVLVDDAITREDPRNHFIFATARADRSAASALRWMPSASCSTLTSRLSIRRATFALTSPVRVSGR